MVFARFLCVLVCEDVRGSLLKFLRTFGISRFSPTKLSLFSSHVSFTHSDETSELFVILKVSRCIISDRLILVFLQPRVQLHIVVTYTNFVISIILLINKTFFV